MAEWAVGLIGVVLGIGTTMLWQLVERKERYRVITFEKRLEVHQKAFYWCMKIANLLGQSYGEISSEEASLHSITLDGLYNEANDWWGNNCLYLEEYSRNSMFTAIGLPLDRAEQLVGNVRETDEFVQQARDTVRKTIDHVSKGIGYKHLPDISREFKKSIIPKR